LLKSQHLCKCQPRWTSNILQTIIRTQYQIDKKPWKLNLYTGEFYDERNGKRLGKIKEEDLIAIWQIRGIRKIIIAERAMY